MTNFYDLKEQLVREQKIFDRATMKQLAYPDLILCAIGDAGKARCGMEEVLAETAERRAPFVNMPIDKILLLKNHLTEEGMYEDVMNDAIGRSEIASYKRLTTLQRLYFKLRCLRNHQDYPARRLQDALVLAQSLLNENFEQPLIQKWLMTLEALNIDVAASKYKNNIGYTHFRKSLQGVRELLTLMTPAEMAICETETLRDYSCSHNCFTPNFEDLLRPRESGRYLAG
jgi:hypothetical protein